MSNPVRSKRPLTLAREFKNSVKVGPRVWLITAGTFVCLLGLPLLSHLLSLLATVAMGIGLLFVAPVIVSVIASGVFASLRRRMVVRVFTPEGGGPASAARKAGVPLNGPRNIRQAEVIQVKTVENP